MKNMLKKSISLLLTVMMIITAVPMTASAETDITSYLTYKINNGEVTITDCNTSISGDVVIPETIEGYPVRSIASEAFRDCDYIESVIIGNSVTSIGDFAFGDCDSLTSVTIGDSVTSIGDAAFWDCDSLTSITIPDSVTSIGDSAFYQCDSLTSVTIGDSVTSIGYSAFHNCVSLTSVTIGDSVTSIGDYAFRYCYSLTSITIPDSVTSIGLQAFLSYDGPTSITVDENNAYYSSDKYGVLFNKEKTELMQYPAGNERTSYVVPDSVTSIGASAFAYCDRLASITIPDSVTSIGDDAFDYCYSLTSITIPDSVTSIGDGAFSSCYSLTSITIPDSVTSIGSYTFYFCDSLTNITIPDSVTSIGDYAFRYCDSLKDVYYSGTEEQWKKISIGTYNECLTDATIHYNYKNNNISNSMFDGVATKYNHELAQFCADFSLYGYSMSSIGDKLNDAGFTLIKKDDNADRDEVNYFIASKDEEQNGIMKKIIFVGCIGSHKKQWYSNFDPLATERDTSADRGGAPYASSSTKAHLGFADAQEYVYYNLSNYIKNLNENGISSDNIKVFLTGHSRGAATANLLAARLVDEQNLSNALVKSGNIYAYTFATPRPTTDKNSSKYNCIFNIVNPEDLVTKVMLQTWGYNRYGVTYTLPSKTNDTNYKEYLSAMRVYFKEYTGYEYEPYPNGEKATYNIINKMTENVKSPSELYTEKFNATWYWGWEIKLVNKWTTFDFFKKTLLPFVAKETVDWGSMAGVILGPGFFFPSILLYFASPDADLPQNISTDELINSLKSMFGNKFREAHEAETYCSYMHALTAEQITETRKGYKGTVNCPVDVEIYNKKTGELVGRIINNTVDEEVAAGENAVVVDVEGDSKSFWLPSNGDYEIKLIGNDEGTMDYTMSEIDSDAGEMSRVNFFEVEITDGLAMTSDIESEDFIIEEYELTFEDGETLEPTEIFDEEDISVYEIEISTTEGGYANSSQKVNSGDYVSLVATPEDGWEIDGWYENDELISAETEISFVAKSDRNLLVKFRKSHNHEYESVVTAPTCTEKGFTTYTCECGDSYVADYTDKVPHKYSSVVTAPTCTEKGFTTYTCACGDSYVADYTDKVPHKYSSVVTAPTCTEKGFTTYTCACGDSYVSDYVDSAHIPGEWIVVTVAQIGVDGLEQLKCTACDEILDEKVIPAIVPEYLPGDANNDGKISAADARIILRISAKLEKLENYNLPFALFDVNGDGKVTASDARKVLRISAKLE